jgi:hypothetical protein
VAKASDNLFPYLHVVPAAAPSSPAAGSQRLYLDSGNSNKLSRKDSAGTVVVVEGSGGSGITAIPSARYTGPNSGTDLSTSSTSFVDLGSYAASIAAAVNDVLEMTLSGTYYGTNANDRAEFGFVFNGTQAGPIGRHSNGVANTAQIFTFTIQHVVVSGDISSGSVPVKVQWRRASSGGSGPLQWGDSGGLTGMLSIKNLLH